MAKTKSIRSSPLLVLAALLTMAGGGATAFIPLADRVETVETDVRSLEINVQPMNTIDERISGLDRSIVQEKKHVDRRLSTAEGWMADHDRRVVNTNATQTADIASLRASLAQAERDIIELRRRIDR